MDINELIVNNLQVLLDEAQSSKEVKDKFRVKAYKNAIKQIKAEKNSITSGKDALKLPGIGKKIADKIDEIIKTGKLHQVESLGEKLDFNNAINLFKKIWGVGPVKAKELWGAGARNIDDIQNKPAIFKLLTENQKIGLKYFNDLQQRIDRNSIEYKVLEIKKVIQEYCIKNGCDLYYRFCGSYRRRLPTVGDMDLLIAEKNNKNIFASLVKYLIDREIIIESLGLGPTKFLGIIKVNGIAFRLDIEFVNIEEWPFALVYFTGSGSFNEKQRNLAKGMGYSLSEHGLKDIKTGEYVKSIKMEKDIFQFLGMEYLPPWDRI